MKENKKTEEVEVAKEEPKVLEITPEDKIKIKKKPKIKKVVNDDNIIKVNLDKISKPTETESETTKEIEQPIVEITEEKIIEPPKQPELPENLDKLVNFMKETGGDLNDYINLNKDFSSYGDDDLLRSYYKETKPHLNDDEINFLVEDNFSWDEKYDDEKVIKRKKLALKEQVASAKDHLDGLKSKYYEDLKMGSKLTDEQQNAIKFFNESKEIRQIQEQAQKTFINKTEEVFNEDFKGFEYQVGNKRFRYNVSDTEKVKTTQSDINNFVKKFLNEDNQMENASGYHKSLFTAMNSDAIANHFYEQGKADALKESIAKSKNISMDARQTHNEPVQSGVKVRVLGGDNSQRATFKIKKRK